MRHFICTQGKSHFSALGRRFVTKDNGRYSTDEEPMIDFLMQNNNFIECFDNGTRMKLRDLDKRDMPAAEFKKKYDAMDKANKK